MSLSVKASGGEVLCLCHIVICMCHILLNQESEISARYNLLYPFSSVFFLDKNCLVLPGTAFAYGLKLLNVIAS